jgi:translation initiation factor 2 subunit 3
MAQVGSILTVRRKIPKQPECNIGTVGHVDHGKCLGLDEYILLDGLVLTGRDIFTSLAERGKLLRTVDGGEVYQLKRNRVVSISDNLRPVEAESLFYLQRYKGSISKIKTDSGRTISVTPEHPLLVNRNGVIQWKKMRDIEDGDYLAFSGEIPTLPQPNFPDPIPILAKSYAIVTYSDYLRLQRVTDDFARFASLNGPLIDKLRILTRTSRSKLSRLCNIDFLRLSSFLSGRRHLSQRQLSRIQSTFRGLPVQSLLPGSFLLEPKSRGNWSNTRLQDADLDSDMVKWLAFVWAEGTSTKRSIRVAQKVQMGMLREFLEITHRKFGLQFKKYGEIDYHLNCKGLVDYLRAKFSFHPGSKSESPIESWILGAGNELRSVFLRWFLTLDGEFNPKSGQIMVSRANERSIVILGYLLQTLGITPRFSVASSLTQKGVRTYHRLMVSGRRNLKLFLETVGFEDDKINSKLTQYLNSIDDSSKESDPSLPINTDQLDDLVFSSGLSREAFPASSLPAMKSSSWYRAYSTARRTGRISRSKLLSLIESVETHINRVEYSIATLGSSSEEMLQLMTLSRISQSLLSEEMGFSRKKLMRILRLGRAGEAGASAAVVKKLARENLDHTLRVLHQFKLLANSPLEFDKIRSVRSEEYDGYIFDLTVPAHANFLAGKGAIVCHNTSLTQSITGVWASAHSEELKRGITIKVGYADAAFYKCPHTPPPACYSTSPICPVCGKESKLLRCVSFVDCPGHESLMTNMLAGAALMDGSILVIAANEPVPRPQTREHLQALQMLDMKRIVVVQNKVDLVDDDTAKKNYYAIKNFVSNTIAADAPIIPISAQHHVNIDALIEAIEERIPTLKRDVDAHPLMYVLRSFDVNKPGIDISSLVGGVLGGSLIRGELHVGDEIEILPGILDEKTGRFSGLITKISTLGTGAGMTDRVGPAGLVAVGTQLDPSLTKADSMLGSVIGKPGTLPNVWNHLRVELQLFESAVGSPVMVKVEKVRKDELLRLNIGTASVLGTVTSVRDTTAELDLRKPVAAEENTRIAVSRRIAERWRLIGSGIIK